MQPLSPLAPSRINQYMDTDEANNINPQRLFSAPNQNSVPLNSAQIPPDVFGPFHRDNRQPQLPPPQPPEGSLPQPSPMVPTTITQSVQRQRGRPRGGNRIVGTYGLQPHPHDVDVVDVDHIDQIYNGAQARDIGLQVMGSV